MSSSEETLNVLRRYCDAWVGGDAATVVALYADDIVLHYFGDNPLAGDHAGKSAALAALGSISRLVQRETPEIHEVLAGGEHGAILARERWTADGETHVIERVFVYHVRDGELAECWVYDADQRLVDRLLSTKRE